MWNQHKLKRQYAPQSTLREDLGDMYLRNQDGDPLPIWNVVAGAPIRTVGYVVVGGLFIGLFAYAEFIDGTAPDECVKSVFRKACDKIDDLLQRP
jgi:hypothetical protein